MTTAQVLAILKASGTAQTAKTHRRHGAQGEVYGVSHADLGYAITDAFGGLVAETPFAMGKMKVWMDADYERLGCVGWRWCGDRNPAEERESREEGDRCRPANRQG